MSHSRRIRNRFLLGHLLVVGMAVTLPAHPPTQDHRIAWQADFHAALAEAEASGRPLLVCFNMDGEAANERTLAFYHDEDFAAAAAAAVCVMCSVDDHGDGECHRFGGIGCREHMSCEKQARKHFYGDLRNNVAPQHIILYPDGVVAWHGIFERTKSQIIAALGNAVAGAKAPLKVRLRKQINDLRKLRTAAKNVPHEFMRAQAMLMQTPAEHFAEALDALGDDELAMRMLEEMVGFRAARALPLAEAAHKARSKRVREKAATVAERLSELAAEPAEPTTPEAAQPMAETASSSGGADAPLTARLPALGRADAMARVYWTTDDIDLDDLRGHITVLWYFHPDAANLASEIERHRAFAAQATGVRVIGVCAAVAPSEMLPRLTELGADFPLGAYPPALRLNGVQMFPAWLVVDPDLGVVHRSPGDGSRFDWSEALQIAKRMADSGLYELAATRESPAP